MRIENETENRNRHGVLWKHTRQIVRWHHFWERPSICFMVWEHLHIALFAPKNIHTQIKKNANIRNKWQNSSDTRKVNEKCIESERGRKSIWIGMKLKNMGKKTMMHVEMNNTKSNKKSLNIVRHVHSTLSFSSHSVQCTQCICQHLSDTSSSSVVWQSYCRYETQCIFRLTLHKRFGSCVLYRQWWKWHQWHSSSTNQRHANESEGERERQNYTHTKCMSSMLVST